VGIDLSTGDLNGSSNQKSPCDLGRLKRGFYPLQVNAPPSFRFSIHPSGKVYPLEEGILALLDSDTLLSVALTEGIFTTPFQTAFTSDRIYGHPL
jgi:hypothetical protein